MIRYRESEMAAYEPPACPKCGGQVDQAWVDVTSPADGDPMYTPGRWVCLTPGCSRSHSQGRLDTLV